MAAGRGVIGTRTVSVLGWTVTVSVVPGEMTSPSTSRRERDAGGDRDPAKPGTVRASGPGGGCAGQHPGGHPGPAEGSVRCEQGPRRAPRRRDGRRAAVRQSRRAAARNYRRRPTAPSVSIGRVVVKLDREPESGGLARCARPRHRVGEPAELVLELGPGDDGGVEAQPAYRRERLAVGDRQVDEPVVVSACVRSSAARRGPPAGGRGCRASAPAGSGRCRGGTMLERDAGPGHALGAAGGTAPPSPPTATTRSAPSRADSWATATPASAFCGDVETGPSSRSWRRTSRHSGLRTCPADPGQRTPLTTNRDSRHTIPRLTPLDQPGGITGPQARRSPPARPPRAAGLRSPPSPPVFTPPPSRNSTGAQTARTATATRAHETRSPCRPFQPAW